MLLDWYQVHQSHSAQKGKRVSRSRKKKIEFGKLDISYGKKVLPDDNRIKDTLAAQSIWFCVVCHGRKECGQRVENRTLLKGFSLFSPSLGKTKGNPSKYIGLQKNLVHRTKRFKTTRVSYLLSFFYVAYILQFNLSHHAAITHLNRDLKEGRIREQNPKSRLMAKHRYHRQGNKGYPCCIEWPFGL